MIRPLVQADISPIKGILDETQLFPADMIDDMVSGFLSGGGHDLWYVHETDRVNGFSYCEPERMTDGTWNLLALAVDPTNQGSGIGRALIEHTRQQLALQKARLLLIETTDIEEFKGQRDFYVRCGLTQVAHIADYYENGVGKVTFAQKLS